MLQTTASVDPDTSPSPIPVSARPTEKEAANEGLEGESDSPADIA